jgi:hypothetical protein
MTGTFRAFLDASVLYSAPLRDLLMRLTLAGLYQARWSNDVRDEWTRALLRDRPDLTAGQLDRVRSTMDQHGEDCLVTGYESLITSLTLPDPDDRHVLAAAILAGAGVIVTTISKIFRSKVWPSTILRRSIRMSSYAMSSTLAPVLVVNVVRAQQACFETSAHHHRCAAGAVRADRSGRNRC